MSDLISKKAAIEAISTWDKFGVDERGRIVRWYEGLEPYVHLRDVVTAIVNLPSAQPELVAQGAYVRGFEQGRTQGMLDVKLQPTCNQIATDCISRQAAIDAIEEMQIPIMRSEFPEEQFVFTGMSEALNAIKRLPSTQPEQKWIPCSEPPTEHGFYHEILLYGKDGNYAVGWYDEDYFTWDDRFDMDTPVAWCELPEPWRGKSNDRT